ncbi:MAG: S8 family serine peptidase, partial [Anaerolineae bacterium]|nr:S8 family serine peptidase [Anaerolineae bacterium]
STAFNTTDQGSDKNGTSMASPHVAGAAALMIQQNPSWSVQEIKALLMNTALRPVVLDPYRYGPARVGAGIVTLSSATNSPVIAYNTADPELVSLSFGVLNVTAAGTYTKSLTVENKGGYACDYTATFVDIVQQNDVSYSVTPGPITVNGNGGQANFQVALTVPDPAAWNEPHNHDPTVRETLSRARHWLSESSGYVELRGGNCPTLWVPVYAAPRPSADLSVTTDTIEVTDLVGTVDVEMVGTGLNTGSNYPYDEISMVSAFELAFTSDELGFTDQRAAADLEYVGITSNYLGNGSDIGNTKIFFGISAYGEWSSLSEETRFEISIDTDEDGTADFTLWNWNYGNPSGNDSSDEFVPVLRQIGGGYYGWPGDYVNWFAASLYDTVPFQNRVMFISVPASRLGLDASNTTFNYWIISRDMNYGDIDSTDVLSYDVAAQLQNFAPGGGSPLWLDQPGVILSVDYDLNVLDPTCILLLHHHNTDSPDNRAETVCIQEEVVRPPGDQDDTDEDSGSGGDGGNWTPPDQGDLSGVTGLPPTGYPPETEFRSTTWVWAVLAGVLVVFAAGLGSIYVYRKSDRKL